LCGKNQQLHFLGFTEIFRGMITVNINFSTNLTHPPREHEFFHEPQNFQGFIMNLTLYAMVQSARIKFILRLLFFFSRKHAIKLFDFSSTSVVVQYKKNRALYLSWFNRGGPTKFKSTFFPQVKLRFSKIFEKIP